MKLPRQLYSFIAIFIFTTIMWGMLAALGAVGATRKRKALQLFTYRNALKIWGIRLHIEGELQESPVFLVANHCSYIDVAVLGAVGNMRFTPKSDVRRWAVIGQMVQAFDVIFVDRTPRKAKETQADVMQALASGDRICVFPEGTTSNGRLLKPFKPTLFSLAERWHEPQPLAVQPLVVDYVAIDGKPITDKGWDKIAWYGDDSLIAHLWHFSGLKRVDVTVHCLRPLTLAEGEGRKGICERARSLILQKLPHISEPEEETS